MMAREAKIPLADGSEIWVSYTIVDREKMVFVMDSMIHVAQHPEEQKVGVVSSLCWLMAAIGANAAPFKDVYAAIRESIHAREQA